MNQDTLVIVMGHREIQRTFDRHLPFWEAHGFPLLVVCPADSILKTTWPVLGMERSTHHGPEINRKFRRILQYCETMNFSEFVFFEYDALCLNPKLERSYCGQIVGNRFTNNQPQFKGSIFLHPPLAFSMDMLERINRCWGLVRDDEEFGFWDRWLGLLCDRGDIPTADWGDLGFARNTIEPGDIPAAVEARKRGACMFHGVKTEPVLKALISV